MQDLKSVKSNEDFLTGLFGDISQIWVADKNGMFGGFAPRKLKTLSNHTSNYFSPNKLKAGAKSRTNTSFESVLAIVLDDVGTKISVMDVEMRAPEPSWVIETSAGNFQYGFLLETEVRDEVLFTTYMYLIKQEGNFWQGASDGTGSCPYKRLPFGVSHKNGFVTRLTHWAPEVKYRFEDLMSLMGLDVFSEDNQAAAQRASGGGDALGALEAGEGAGDIILDLFGLLGDVGGPNATTGWQDVTCPWEDGHTDAGTGGSAYHVRGGYRCHHSHCAGRDIEALREKLWTDERTGAEYRRLAFPPLPDEEKDEALHRTVEKRDMVREIALLGELSRARKRLPDFEEFQGFKGDTLPRAHSVTVRPPRVLMGLQRDDVTLLAASPAAGKSLLSLQMALAVAHENPSIIGGKFVDWTGDVVIVSNEDSKDVVLRRVEAVEKFFGLDPALRKHDIHVATGPGITLLSKTGNQIKPSCLRLLQFMVDRRRDADIALVVIDTLSSVMRGMNENDNQEMQQVMDFAKHISRSAFSSLMLVHHLSKAGSSSQNGAGMDKARGASSIVGAIRSGLELGPVSDADASRYGWLDQAERSKWVRLDSTKSSYEAKMGGQALSYYKWHTLTVPTRDARDGQIHDLGVGVLKPETPPPFTQNPAMMRGYLDKIQDALDAGEEITLHGKAEMKGPYRTVWDVLGMTMKKGMAVFDELEKVNLVRRKSATSKSENPVFVVDVVAHDTLQPDETV